MHFSRLPCICQVLSQKSSHHEQSSMSINKQAWHEFLPYKPNDSCTSYQHNMVYDKTFMCPSKHLSSSIGKQTICHSSNLLRYMRSLRWAQIISLTSAAITTTSLQDLPPPLPLLLLLDVPCLDFEAVPVSPYSCPPRGPQTFTSKSLTSQNVLTSAPLTFSQVKLPLKTCSQVYH